MTISGASNLPTVPITKVITAFLWTYASMRKGDVEFDKITVTETSPYLAIPPSICDEDFVMHCEPVLMFVKAITEGLERMQDVSSKLKKVESLAKSNIIIPF